MSGVSNPFSKEGLPEAFCTKCELDAKVKKDITGQKWVVCLYCKYKYPIDMSG